MSAAPPLRKLLFADDDADVRELVRLSLCVDPQIEVLLCGSGAELLEAARRELPDLILLDVMMPQLDGPMTLAKLREQPPSAHVPVVFITAKALPDEIDRLRAFDVVDVICKPFDPRTLAERIRTLWSRLHERS